MKLQSNIRGAENLQELIPLNKGRRVSTVRIMKDMQPREGESKNVDRERQAGGNMGLL